ncbi:MAG: DUF2523 family protein [Acidithiobacillus sp.]|nr:DUF2523 family protein [Acidithiobacillus sp.]
MGAILSALADWLGPFLLGLVNRFGPTLLLSLGVGFGTFTGLSAIQQHLSSVVFDYSALPADMLDIARLLGVIFVLKLFVSAFAVRVSIMSASFFLKRMS